ncbi:hypothetical protein R1sor_018050 [Riccia sorocarpa]|uniref:Phosphatidylinositol transfer protein N-terminal domain-containing protein n=1 Tax=Riccia sorocarpa TaxID=122646 RepID=A0ABD3I8L8_9MARC
MVQLTEFRVVMPLSLEEYRIAQMYMVTKMQEQQTSGTEGVEVLVNEPFENEEFGKGQYTSKIYHLQSKAPAWLTAIAPANSLIIEEEAWNAYPKCKTGEYRFTSTCPYFTRFKLTVETIHVADNGQSHNVHNLPNELLNSRKVEVIDIASNVRDYWSYVIGGPPVDLETFQSKKTGRGLLQPGWQSTANPVMTAYKLVTVDAPYWGFGYRLEQLLLGGERALFVESHKRCFAWIDDWYGLSFEDVRQMELRMDQALNEALHHQHAPQTAGNPLAPDVKGSTLSSSTGTATSDVIGTQEVDAREQQQLELQKNCAQNKIGGEKIVETNVQMMISSPF